MVRIVNDMNFPLGIEIVTTTSTCKLRAFTERDHLAWSQALTSAIDALPVEQRAKPKYVF